MNLGTYVSRSAQYWPDAEAVIYKDLRLSYAELEDRTNRLAKGLLSLGLAQGDRVGVYSWNRNEVLEMEVACYKAGLAKVPINARLSRDEAVHIVNDSGSSIVIADAQHIESLLGARKEMSTLQHIIGIKTDSDGTINYDELIAQQDGELIAVDVAADEISVLHYTSGTSGKLKAAIQTHGNRLAMIRKALMIPQCSTQVGDKFALLGPITHATGMNIMPNLFTGCCNLIMDRFDPEEFLKAVEAEKITHTFMVPTMINMLLNHPDCAKFDTSSIKAIIYGAAPMSPARVEQAIGVFGPVLVQGYGAGETTSIVTTLTSQDHVEALQNNKERLASCGRPRFDTELRIVNEKGEQVRIGEIGEIIVRGPDIMKGYWQAPELTKEVLKDGWYFTGDLAKMDDEGYIYIVDRKKEMIISGGFNVYPTEIESILFNHPAVFEACVIGIPDEKWGEAIKAVVVLKEGAQASEEDLISHCAEYLAGFKKPQTIEFVDNLPKNPNGKIVRRVIRDQFWKGSERKV